MLEWLSQMVAVTFLGVRSIPQRMAPSVVAIIGIAGVVIVLVSVLSIAEGFRATMLAVGDPDVAIVMRAGSTSEDTSVIQGEDAAVIQETPGIALKQGRPLVSAEVYTIVNLAKRSTGTLANVPLRGVGPLAFSIRDEVRIVEGRPFEPGRNEILVGRAASRQFAGLEVGRTVRWGTNTWTIVGLFEAAGGINESELWCDATVLQAAYRRGHTFQSVWARLETAEAFATVQHALTTDPRLDVMVVSEADYYAEKATLMARLITTLGFGIGALMAIGAVFGAVNTMYTAVAARTREIATLRALGFGAGAVMMSVLAESAFLALLGGALGGALAWTVFDGYHTATLNQQTFSQVAFTFAVTPRLLTAGIAAALVMGLLGGVLPAIQAAHLPIASALREF